MHLATRCSCAPPALPATATFSRQSSGAVWVSATAAASDVELERLSLRRDAFRGLDLPIDVRAGLLGQLTLKIPWSNLRGKSVVMEIRDVFILAARAPAAEYNSQAEEARHTAQKLERLEALEALVFQADSPADKDAAVPSSSLADIILDNIQVVINNVHIRFEDFTADGTHQAFGITVARISGRSADANWQPKYVQEHQVLVHKLLELERLAVYSDTSGEPWSAYINRPWELREKFAAAVLPTNNVHFLLQPVSALGRMRRNKLPGLKSVPQFTLEIEAQDIPLVVSHQQLKGLMFINKVFEKQTLRMAHRQRLYRRLQPWRPPIMIKDLLDSQANYLAIVTPSGDTRETAVNRSAVVQSWWKYALEAVKVMIVHRGGSGRSFRIDPVTLTNRRSLKAAYIKIWIRKLTTLNLDPETTNQISDLHDVLTLDDIVLFRSLARKQIRRDPQARAEALAVVSKRQEQKKGGSTWYGWFFGGSSTPTTASTTVAASAASSIPQASQAVAAGAATDAPLAPTLSDADRETLFEQVDDGEASAAPSALSDKQPFVAADVSLKLARGSLVLLGRHRTVGPDGVAMGEALADFAFGNLSCSFKQWAGGRQAGVAVAMELERVTLHDRRHTDPAAHLLIGPKPAPLLNAHDASDNNNDANTKHLDDNDDDLGQLTGHQHSQSFLTGAFALHRPDGEVDVELKLHVQPLQITVDPAWLSRLNREWRHFGSAEDVAALSTSIMGGLANTAATPMRRSKSGNTGLNESPEAAPPTAAASLRPSVAWKKAATAVEPLWAWTLLLDVDIRAPLIVVADSAFSAHPTLQHFVVLDLGCLRAHNLRARTRVLSVGSETFETPPSTPGESPSPVRPSTPVKKGAGAEAGAEAEKAKEQQQEEGEGKEEISPQRLSEADSSEPPSDALVSKYTLELSNVQMVAIKGPNWPSALQSATATSCHIVHGFSLACDITHQRRLILAPTQPRIAVSGKLPLLSLALSESRLESLLACTRDVGVAFQGSAGGGSGNLTPQEAEMPYSMDDMTASVADTAAFRAGRNVSNAWDADEEVVQWDPITALQEAAASQAADGDRLLDLNFHMEQLDISLASRQPLVVAHIIGVKVLLAHGSSSDVAQFAIGKLQVVDMTQPEQSEFRHLVTTHRDADADSGPTSPYPEQRDFIFVRFTQHKQDLAGGRRLTGAKGTPPSSATLPPGASPQGLYLDVLVDCIHVNLNRDTIVHLLDFRSALTPTSVSAAPSDWPPAADSAAMTASIFVPPATEQRYKISLKIGSVSVMLVRNSEKLAYCGVNRMEVGVDVRNSQSTVSGRLGALALRDLTPAGALYSSVFSTSGDDMLRFEFATLPPGHEDAKLPFADETSQQIYGTPGAPQLMCSSRLRIHMGSIRYVHTQRFVALVSNFATQLQNMQQVMAQMRMMAAGIAAELQRVTYHDLTRLDVKIDSPVVVVPRNSLSTSVLEADLGRTSMTTTLKLLPPGKLADGTTGDVGVAEGVFGVAQCVQVSVKDMRLCSAQHVLPRPPRTSSEAVQRSHGGGSAGEGLILRSNLNEPAGLTLLRQSLADLHLAGSTTATIAAATAATGATAAGGAVTNPALKASRRARKKRHKVPLYGSNLDDSEDTPQHSGEEGWSDSDSGSLASSSRPQAEVHEVARFELVSQCSLNISFASNLTLERHDIPNSKLDIHVSNVEVQASRTQYDLVLGMLQENMGVEAELLATQDWVELESTNGAIANAAHVAGRRSTQPPATTSAAESRTVTNTTTPTGERPSATPQVLAVGGGAISPSVLRTIEQWNANVPTSPLSDSSGHNATASPVPAPVAPPPAPVPLPPQTQQLPADSEAFAAMTWVGNHVVMHFENVTLQLLDNLDGEAAVPLARFDLVDSKLSYKGFTDGTPRDSGSTITLSSRAVRIHDSRKQDPLRPNCFTTIFVPMESTLEAQSAASSPKDKAPQLQLTQRGTPGSTKIKVLMNKARLIVSPEWAIAVAGYFDSRPPSGMLKFYDQQSARIRHHFLLASGWDPQTTADTAGALEVEGPAAAAPAGPSDLTISINVTEPEFVLINDATRADSEAIVLTFCSAMTFRQLTPLADSHHNSPARGAKRSVAGPPAVAGGGAGGGGGGGVKQTLQEEIMEVVLEKLEVFSCILQNKETTALSIVDPTNVTANMTRTTTLRDKRERLVETDLKLDVEAWLPRSGLAGPVSTRLSYTDLALFVSIADQFTKVGDKPAEPQSAASLSRQGSTDTVESVAPEEQPKTSAAESAPHGHHPHLTFKLQSPKGETLSPELMAQHALYQHHLSCLRLIEPDLPLCLRVLSDCDRNFVEAAFVLSALHAMPTLRKQLLNLLSDTSALLAPFSPAGSSVQLVAGGASAASGPSPASSSVATPTPLSGLRFTGLLPPAALHRTLDASSLLRLGAGSSQFSERYATLDTLLTAKNRQREQLVSQLADARATAAEMDARGDDETIVALSTQQQNLVINEAPATGASTASSSGADSATGTSAVGSVAPKPADDSSKSAASASGPLPAAVALSTSTLSLQQQRERDAAEQRSLITQLETRLDECEAEINRLSGELAAVGQEAAQLLTSIEQQQEQKLVQQQQQTLPTKSSSTSPHFAFPGSATATATTTATHPGLSAGMVRQDKVARLAALGFAENDCVLALKEMRGDFEGAAEWLFFHAPRLRVRHPLNTARILQAWSKLGAAAMPGRSGAARAPHDSSSGGRFSAIEEEEYQTAASLAEESRLLRASQVSGAGQTDNSEETDPELLAASAEAAAMTTGAAAAAAAAVVAPSTARAVDSSRSSPSSSAHTGVLERKVRSVASPSRPLQRLGTLDRRLLDPRSQGLSSPEEYEADTLPRQALTMSPRSQHGSEGAEVAGLGLVVQGFGSHDYEAGSGLLSQTDSPRVQSPLLEDSVTENGGVGPKVLQRHSRESAAGSGGSGAPRDSLAAPATSATSAERLTQKYNFDIDTRAVALCIIDDCQGRDVPLLELKGGNLTAHVNISVLPDYAEGNMTADGQMQVDFFNAALSVWEPLLEKFRASISGHYKSDSNRQCPSMQLDMFTDDRLEFTVTPVLMRNLLSAAQSWTTALEARELRQERRPYVPYRVHNACGLDLWVTKVLDSARDPVPLKVEADQVVDIHFHEASDRHRHRESGAMAVHKLAVRVEGYRETKTLIIADRTGTFVHLIAAEGRDLPSTQIVAEVRLEDGRKYIRLRSGLLIRNKTSIPIDLRLDADSARPTTTLPTLAPLESKAVPIQLTGANLSLRPHGWGTFFCQPPVTWQQSNLDREGDKARGYLLQCDPIGGEKSSSGEVPFFLCGTFIKDEVPEAHRHFPCHTLTLVAPLTLCNLLPCEMAYEIGGAGHSISGSLASGESTGIYDADIRTKDLMLRVKVKHFQLSSSATINRGHNSGSLSGVDPVITMVDSHHRPLNLRLSIQRARRAAAAKVVSVYADYWFINRTGLPLLFQAPDSTGFLPGSPWEEDEPTLKSEEPLLVSWDTLMGVDSRSGLPITAANGDGGADFGGSGGGGGGGGRSNSAVASPDNHTSSARCFVRVGKFSDRQLMAVDVSGAEGSLEPIQIRTAQGMPLGRFYTLGMEVARGDGRYRRTKVVTLVPSYVLVNATERDLMFYQEGLSGESHIDVKAGARLPFHWPDLRRRQRLVAKFVDSSGVQWDWTHSFPIDELGTYHIKLYRRRTATASLVRVDVHTKGPAREVIFSDADAHPPFRLENHSMVPVVCHQVGCSSVFELKPGGSVPYAWDSLSKPLALQLQERYSPESWTVQYELQRLGDGPRLKYQQNFYIRSTTCGLVVGAAPLLSSNAEPTFIKACMDEAKVHDPHQLFSLQPDGRVVNNAGYQLELTNRGVADSQVMLRRVTEGPPTAKECWKFEQGRLLSHFHVRSTNHTTLQGAPYALQVLAPGRVPHVGDALIGTVAPTMKLMAEQSFHQEFVPPGSGAIVGRVYADGLTRVLRLEDEAEWRHRRQAPANVRDLLPTFGHATMDEDALAREANGITKVVVTLGGGVGLSVVDDEAVEVVYFSSRGIGVGFTRDNQVEEIDFRVRCFQLDQQLEHTPEHPVIICAEEGAEAVAEGSATVSGPGPGPNPVVAVHVERSRTVRGQATVFRLLDISVGLVHLNLEEVVLLRLIHLARRATQGVLSPSKTYRPDDALFLPAAEPELVKSLHSVGGLAEVATAATAATALAAASNPTTPPAAASSLLSNTTYFEELRVSELRFRITLVEATSLPPELAELRRTMPTLFSMNNVGINLEAFRLARPFVNQRQLFTFVGGHLQQGILRHLPKIAGSLDILGNPYGLGKSMVSGVRAFLDETTRGDVITGGMRMAQHLTRGLADSAAKVTKSLSSKVSRATMDRQYMLEREKSLAVGRQSGHLSAGAKQLTNSFTSGLLGVVREPIRGAQESGPAGFFSGVVRGVVGAFVKPVTGMLDFAAETSALVHEQASGSSRVVMHRERKPRAIGPDRAVRPYSSEDAHGRDLMLTLNRFDLSERFVKRLTVTRQSHMSIMVTSERVLILEQTDDGSYRVSSEAWFSGFVKIMKKQSETRPGAGTYMHYIQLTVIKKMHEAIQSALGYSANHVVPITSPTWRENDEAVKLQTRCDSEEIADEVIRIVNFSHHFYLERRQSVRCLPEAEALVYVEMV